MINLNLAYGVYREKESMNKHEKKPSYIALIHLSNFGFGPHFLVHIMAQNFLNYKKL